MHNAQGGSGRVDFSLESSCTLVGILSLHLHKTGHGPPLQGVALHYRAWPSITGPGPPLQGVALHYRAWPYTAGCGPPLQGVALHYRAWPSTTGPGPPLQGVALHYRAWPYTAGCGHRTVEHSNIATTTINYIV